MDINNLRTTIKNKRNALSKEKVAVLSKEITKKFFTLDFVKDKKNFFVYNSIKNEVDTSYIINTLKSAEKTIAYPITIGNEMVAGIPTVDEWEVGGFNVKIPTKYTVTTEIDVAVIPLLICDENKNRVGYGKGYYDKFLSKNDCIKVGICYDFQVVESITPNEWDVPLDYIITPTKIITK